jgi:hypothetical protein
MGKTKALPKVRATSLHRIGKTLFIVTAESSETATDTLGEKIEKLIAKDVAQEAKTEP